MKPFKLMDFAVKSANPQKQRTPCMIVAVFENKILSKTAEQIDSASDGYISKLLASGDLDGKLKQMRLLHHVPGTLAERILLVGCGKQKEFSEQQFSELHRKIIATLNETGATEAVCFLTEEILKERDAYWRVRLAVEACVEATYSFEEYKTKKNKTNKALKKITFSLTNRRDVSAGERGLNEGLAIGEAVAFTKTLGDLPANICTPSYLAAQAEALVKKENHISVAVLEEDQIEALNMGAFLAVSQGSEEPPKFITLEYRGAVRKGSKPIVFVGKGITFDTGGNSLKPPSSMIGMKYDMCGAATVLGVIKAASSLELPLHIVGVIPTCENMQSGRATRPDDIVKSLSGTHIEILNTDAEGRLILCDALSYVERYEPEVVIDIATLTGACVVALGRHASGLLGNNQALIDDLLKAGVEANDRAWQLPLWEEYGDTLKSNFADLANIGGPEAGTITAAAFLSNFTKKYHWAHLDVAGTAARFSGTEKGATGRPVPLLMQYLLDRLKTHK